MKARQKKIMSVIADLGNYTSVKQSRLYAAIKGVKDAGVNVPCAVEVMPSLDRLSGKHIAVYAAQLAKLDVQKYQKYFSRYLKINTKPEALPELFAQTVKKLESGHA